MMKQHATAISLLLCLAACGGGGGGGGGSSGIDPRLARLDIYEAQKRRVLGDPGAGVPAMEMTTAENIPTMGAVAFTGSATIRVETGTNPLVLFGDASLEMRFDTGDGDGTLDNFFGNNAAGDVVNLAGAIDVAADLSGTDLGLNYVGALSSSADVIAISGRMQGALLGNPVAAFAAADFEPNVTHNGVDRDATIVVIGEVEPMP